MSSSATLKERKSVETKVQNLVEIPVDFGNVSIGDETARLSIKINKNFLNIIAAEELLCGRRLTGSVQLGGIEDMDGQQTLFEADVIVPGTFDVHRFGVSPKVYTTSLTFRLAEIEVGDIARFSKGRGRLIVQTNKPIPHDVVDEHDEEDQATLPGTFSTDQPWRQVSLDHLFSGGILKSMKGAGLMTVGDLHDFQQPAKNGYVKSLTDIKGIGESKVQQIEDRMMEFWRDNQQD